MSLDDRLDELGVRGCVACGRCTWACPVSRRPGDFSPRTLVERILKSGKIPRDGGIWSCTNCGMCTEVCDSGVRFHEFVRELRVNVREDMPSEMTHGGIIPIIRSLTSMDYIRPRKSSWITDDLSLDQGSSTLLFVGCIPYFDVVFREFRDDLLEIPRAAVRLLNAMGISPAIMEDERCCGHDAYWMGEEETFQRLAEINVKAIESMGVEQVIMICPEGYWTFKEVYPSIVGPLGFEVRSLTEMAGRALEEGGLELENGGVTMTFQDPCRLARLSGIIDQPRSVIDAVGKRVEMERSGRLSACCGHSNWVNCDIHTMEWQLERLEEASEAGAEMLVTACPKCLIHLSCAQRNLPEKVMKIEDLHVLAARALLP